MLAIRPKSHRSSPPQEWAYRLQSCVYSQKNNKKKRLQHALEAVKQEPESVLALQALAYAQLHRKKYKEATATAKKIREIAPDSADTHKTCGYVEFSKGNLVEAEEYFRRALKIEANDYNSLNTLGEVLLEKFYKTSDYKMKRQIINEAIDCFRQAIAINPILPEAKENLKKANFNSLSGSQFIILPLLISVAFLITLVLNSNAYVQYRPEFLNIKDKPPEILLLYVFSWLGILIASLGITVVKAQDNLTETNQNILKIIDKPTIFEKLAVGFWLLVSTYPLIFILWKLLTFDFESFYLFKALDWITLSVGVIAFFLNRKLIAPYLPAKKKASAD
jgi:tetratricopeptide (TPR) repeat protein